MSETLGAFIMRHRLARGLTPRTAAAMAKLSHHGYVCLEMDMAQQRPTDATMQALGSALRFNPKDAPPWVAPDPNDVPQLFAIYLPEWRG